MLSLKDRASSTPVVERSVSEAGSAVTEQTAQVFERSSAALSVDTTTLAESVDTVARAIAEIWG
jgi:hypothetical protein